jgi:hypothetical protein
MSDAHQPKLSRPGPLASLPFDRTAPRHSPRPRLTAAVADFAEPPPERFSDGLAEGLSLFCRQVLGSIPRTDQRRWGRFYVRGLLSTPGRKTVTRMVQTLAAPPVDQALQQFVNQSPWEWIPVRRDLAAVLEQVLAPEAWVVQPAFFPKSGERSVGVTRQFVPPLAKLMNCQAAMSVWLAGADRGSPVDWRLVMPPSWTNGDGPGAQVGVPVGTVAEEQWECAVEIVTDLAHRLGIPRRPSVLDFRRGRPGMPVTRLQDRRIPFLMRIDSSSVVWSGPRLAAGAALPRSAMLQPLGTVTVASDGQLLAMPWPTPHYSHRAPPVPLHAVPATGPRVRRGELPLGLLADGVTNEPRPRSLWVTNLVGTPVAELTRLAALSQRTETDAERLRGLGLRDFEGRSYRGWHHHVTLVSVAHGYEAARAPALGRASRAG